MTNPISRFGLALLLALLLTACAASSDLFGPAAEEESARATLAQVSPSPNRSLTFEQTARQADAGGNAAPATAPAPAPARGSALKQQIVYGSDRFLKRGQPAAASAFESDDGDITLNFIDADIREVVRSVLGDILELNYSIDPDVTGTATVQTSRPVSRAALLSTLETLLQANGVALVRDGSLYRIVVRENLTRNSVSLASGAAGDPGFGVQVVPLRYVAASEMVGILELFAPEGSILKADSGRNLLILQGDGETREALLDAVELFDVDWIEGMSFGLFPLENAKAETLVAELEAIFGEAGYAPSRELLRFIPVSRLNAVIAISPRAFYLEQAQVWIRQLDQGIDGASERLNVYYVQNTRASELAQVLNDIFGGSERSGNAPEGIPRLTPVAFPSSGGADGGDPGVGQSDDATPLVSSQSIDLGGAGKIRILAAESSNSLLVLASPQNYRMVEQAIRKLDIVPLQVLIEATIAEVTLNDALRYGVQWFFESGDSSFSLSDFASGAAQQAFPGFSYLFQSGADVRVVLNALSNVTDVNVISSPQLMVLDNQTAELQVGDEVPIATQSAVSVDNPNAPIVNSIEFRDTGVILRVTPRVNAGGLVIMEIEQEVSSVVGTTTSGIDSPTIQQRKINSSVAIQSGETVTLGGLISESRERSSSGVPILSEVPVLGALFGRKTDNEVRTELLVLITPRVVANQLDARQVTNELRSRMRAIQPLGPKLQ